MRTQLTAVCLGASLLLGCGGGTEVVRDVHDPSIDAVAMSTSLDKEDVQRMLVECLNDMRASTVMQAWRGRGGQETVAVFPFVNSTSEHIDPMLETMLSEAETWLVESGTVTVISRERQTEMIREVEGERHPVFNPAHVAEYGRQLGAHYIITGKVQSADERAEDSRRVQYFLYMQVIEVATSAIRWQHRAYVTKMIR